jgi:tellurium resistance protein TerD
MSINLQKSQSIDLTKKNPELKKIHIGLGWDAEDSKGKGIDCDVSVFLLNENNKIPGDGYFVFYNNLSSTDGSTIHQGDNRTGEGEGDDEIIKMDLSKIHSDVLQVLFVVTIHDADKNNQDFSMVENAFIRILDDESGNELCRYELTESFANADSVQIGRIYYYENKWNFEAMGAGFTGGLSTLLGVYN